MEIINPSWNLIIYAIISNANKSETDLALLWGSSFFFLISSLFQIFIGSIPTFVHQKYAHQIYIYI